MELCSRKGQKSERFAFGRDSYLGGQDMGNNSDMELPDYELAKAGELVNKYFI